jgi:hypothetical protein
MSRYCRILGALVSVCLLTGCGIASTGPISFGEAPQVGLPGEQLYFILDGKLHPTLRPAPASQPATGQLGAVARLARGPLPAESAAGFTSEVPTGLQAIIDQTARPDDGQSIPTVLLFGTPAPTPRAEATPQWATGLSDTATAQIVCTVAASLSLNATPVGKVRLVRKGVQAVDSPLSCPVPLPVPRR